MRYCKLLVLIACLTLLIAIPASATTTQLSLGNPNTNFVFTGNGTGVVAISLQSGTAMTGTATATGNFVGASDSGTYTLNFATAMPIVATFNGTSFGVVQNGPITFSYVSAGGDTLFGDLQLVGLQQVGSLGVFNQNLAANLTNVSGTLASSLPNGTGIMDITIRLASGVDLSTLNGTSIGQFSTGELTPTPEPASLLLLGGGLLTLGGAVRRKLNM